MNKLWIVLIMLLPVAAHAAWYDSLLNFESAVWLGAIMVIEFALGKTDWIKAGSIVELLLNGLVKIVKKDKAL